MLSLCRAAAPGATPQITVAIAGRRDRAFLTRNAGAGPPPLGAAALRASGVAHLHVGELADAAVERPDLLDDCAGRRD